MQTTYETALNEFRDASAEVRRTYGLVSQTRELQIIADSQHAVASTAHAEAIARQDRADAALTAARAAQSAPPASSPPIRPAIVTEADGERIEAAHRAYAPGPYDAPVMNGVAFISEPFDEPAGEFVATPA